ncbi:hypothetical protein AB0M02_00445 [Actinoplanes sp. NPDC051861]|uniref:DUF7426 family protein n=1 Tax=Actinoplanes sp. NPDC051861 TaxID=3155170 RepID=UPI00342DA25F
MAAKLGDLDDYFSPGLTVTVKGKEYTIPLASAETGLWCRRMAVATGQLHEASTEEEMQAVADRMGAIQQLPGDMTLPEYTLGAVYTEMVADGVEDPYIEYCGMTAYIWIIAGEDAAARWYQSGGRPEATGPNRASRRAAARTGETSSGAATGTRSRASTSGTTSRQKSAKPRKPQKSAG